MDTKKIELSSPKEELQQKTKKEIILFEDSGAPLGRCLNANDKFQELENLVKSALKLLSIKKITTLSLEEDETSSSSFLNEEICRRNALRKKIITLYSSNEYFLKILKWSLKNSNPNENFSLGVIICPRCEKMRTLDRFIEDWFIFDKDYKLKQCDIKTKKNKRK